MSESNGNGILRLTEEGMQKCQLGDGPVFEVDVMALTSNWAEVERGFWGEDGRVVPERRQEYTLAMVDFVRQTFALGGYKEDVTRKINVTQAGHFMAQLTEKASALKRFFVVSSAPAPSSAASTELRFGD